jgi:hypothetical protein
MVTPEDLKRVLESARREVESWPEWKRDVCEAILANRSTRRYPRLPVDDFGRMVEVQVIKGDAHDSVD